MQCDGKHYNSIFIGVSGIFFIRLLSDIEIKFIWHICCDRNSVSSFNQIASILTLFHRRSEINREIIKFISACSSSHRLTFCNGISMWFSWQIKIDLLYFVSGNRSANHLPTSFISTSCNRSHGLRFFFYLPPFKNQWENKRLRSIKCHTLVVTEIYN